MSGPAVMVLALVVCVVAMLWYRKHKASGPGTMPIAIHGLGVVQRTKEVDPIAAEKLGHRLLTLKNLAWPDLELVYGLAADCNIDTVQLDPGYEHVVKLFPAQGRVRMRPAGGQGHPAEYWWVRELHNDYRAVAFGINNIYPDETEREAWQLGEDACLQALECLPQGRPQ